MVSATRLGLWLLPIGAVRRIALSDREKGNGANSIAELVWAVKAVSRYVPVATCLTQALALQWLLARSGHTSRIHLGARKDVEGKFAAHAWVECEDRVVIGGSRDAGLRHASEAGNNHWMGKSISRRGTGSLETTRKTEQLFIANLRASASLRECV